MPQARLDGLKYASILIPSYKLGIRSFSQKALKKELFFSKQYYRFRSMRSFLKVSSRCHYGLIFVFYLAEKATSVRAVSLSDVTAAVNIPQGYLDDIAARLRRAGIVVSSRGPRGGYRLAKKPNEISVADVVEAIEGPVAFVDCLETKTVCTVDKNFGSRCSSRFLWKRVQDSLLMEMRKLSLRDIVAG